MRIVFRAALSLLLFNSLLYSQGGEFSFTKNRQFLVEPSNLVLEHALWDFHHYYSGTDDLKLFDFSVNPFYKHWKTTGEKSTINTAGAFLQGELTLNNVWLRINTIFGNIHQKRTDLDKSSHVDIDDVLIKLGYDFYCMEDSHIAPYLIAGFPTNRDLCSRFAENMSGIIEELIIKTPELGTKHYRFGAGINSGWAVFDCTEQLLTWLFDIQYHYAFRTEYASSTPRNQEANAIWKTKVSADFTPGHTINAWTAFHYACAPCNLEIGSAFTTTFGSSLSAIKKEKNKVSKPKTSTSSEDAPHVTSIEVINSSKVRTPALIKFGATPYIALSYNSLFYTNPTMLGFGVGYDFNRISCRPSSTLTQEPAASKFQGVFVWADASIRF